jgi:DNA-binding MarR family transcriptional regulator
MPRHTEGYVKLHRRILTSWIGRNGTTFSIFATMMCWANREDGLEPLGHELVPIKRGQLATGTKDLATQLKINRKTVERHLEMLERKGTIVQEISKRGRIITLVNYDRDQGSEVNEFVSNEVSNPRPHPSNGIRLEIGDVHSGGVQPSVHQPGQQTGHLMENSGKKSITTLTIRYSVTEMRMHAKRAFAEVRAYLVERAAKPELSLNAKRFVETSRWERWDELSAAFAVEKNTKRDGMFLKNLVEMFERNAEFALTGQATGRT